MKRRDSVPGRRSHPPIAPISLAVQKAAVSERASDAIRHEVQLLNYRGRAARELLIHRGADETIDVVDYILNPTGVAVVVLVSFTVPDGMVAYFDQRDTRPTNY